MHATDYSADYVNIGCVAPPFVHQFKLFWLCKRIQIGTIMGGGFLVMQKMCTIACVLIFRQKQQHTAIIRACCIAFNMLKQLPILQLITQRYWRSIVKLQEWERAILILSKIGPLFVCCLSVISGVLKVLKNRCPM